MKSSVVLFLFLQLFIENSFAFTKNNELFLISANGEVRPYDLPKIEKHQLTRDVEHSKFLVHFADPPGVGWNDAVEGSARKSCFQAAVNFLLDKIKPVDNFPTLRIYMGISGELPVRFLAQACYTFVGSNLYDYPKESPFGLNVVQRLLQQGQDLLPDESYHAFLNWNFSASWFIPAAGCGVQPNQSGADRPGPTQTDMWSVLMHEFFHLFGFGSSLSSSNLSFTGPISGSIGGESSLFDRQFLYQTTSSGQFLPVFALGSANVSHNQFVGPPNSAVTNSIYYGGYWAKHPFYLDLFPPIYARSPFSPGTTFSHWNISNWSSGPCIMAPGIPAGVIRRYPSTIDRGVLKDSGFNSAFTDNDECDSSTSVVFGSYSFSNSMHLATPSAPPTSSSCATFQKDLWYMFIPFWDSNKTFVSMSFTAPFGLAIYESCANTTTSQQIACSSEYVEFVSLPFAPVHD